MLELKAYILHVICAAVLCSIVGSLVKSGNSISAICKLICSVFLTFNIAGPIFNLRISEYMVYPQKIACEAEAIVSDGEKYASDIRSGIIKEKCEAYILDKAASLRASVSVQIQVDEDGLSPCAVVLSGAVSPYTKIQLQEYITQTLGIPEEAQTWILQ